MGRATSNFFAPAPWGPGEGSKVKYHLISIIKSISKIFIPNCVCVLTNERHKAYQTGFSFCRLGHAPVVGLWGAGDAQGVMFFKHGHMAWTKTSSGSASAESRAKIWQVKYITWHVPIVLGTNKYKPIGCTLSKC